MSCSLVTTLKKMHTHAHTNTLTWVGEILYWFLLVPFQTMLFLHCIYNLLQFCVCIWSPLELKKCLTYLLTYLLSTYLLTYTHQRGPWGPFWVVKFLSHLVLQTVYTNSCWKHTQTLSPGVDSFPYSFPSPPTAETVSKQCAATPHGSTIIPPSTTLVQSTMGPWNFRKQGGGERGGIKSSFPAWCCHRRPFILIWD